MLEKFKAMVSNTATITINDETETVRKLTVKELEHYEKIVNTGLGKMQTGLNDRSGQKASIDIEKFGTKQNEADKYLIKRSFLNPEGEETVTDEDINELYELYPVIVSELKRVNHIGEVDTEEVSEAIKN